MMLRLLAQVELTLLEDKLNAQYVHLVNIALIQPKQQKPLVRQAIYPLEELLNALNVQPIMSALLNLPLHSVQLISTLLKVATYVYLAQME